MNFVSFFYDGMTRSLAVANYLSNCLSLPGPANVATADGQCFYSERKRKRKQNCLISRAWKWELKWGIIWKNWILTKMKRKALIDNRIGSRIFCRTNSRKAVTEIFERCVIITSSCDSMIKFFFNKKVQLKLEIVLRSKVRIMTRVTACK